MSEPQPYVEFLAAKKPPSASCGFDVEPDAINPILKPHQHDMVRWAVRRGRAGIFASYGLGKTLVQIETLRLLRERSQGNALVVIPLGVRQEFRRDAALLGIEPKFIRRIEEVDADHWLYLTNYETVRDGKLDPRTFAAVSLDEAAVLRGFGSTKTFRQMMALFEGSGTFRFVATATPSPNAFIELLAYAAFLDVMDVGQAKAQPLDAKVLTPTGWRLMGDISVGDAVIAGDGTPTRVLGVYPQGERPIFRISFSDGAATEADGEHLWETTTHYERNNERRYRERNGTGNDGTRNGKFSSVRTTAEIAATLESQGGKNHSVPIIRAVRFAARDLPIHPWVLGALIGDGCLRDSSVVFSTADEWMLENMAELLPPGLAFHETSARSQDYGISTTPGRKGGSGWGANKLLSALRSMGLLGKRAWEKSIPEDYLLSSVDDRLALLRGLMDTDGTVSASDGQTTFCTVSPTLAEQMVALVRSLGGLATVRDGSTCETTRHPAFIVAIHLNENPFSLPRKAERHRQRGPRSLSRYIVAVEPIGTKPAQCIAIDHPSRLYVTDDYLVTHNTRFFQRNSEKADDLTLRPHKEAEFWHWVATWALFLEKPSDLGYSDEGYTLPPLDIRWYEVPSDQSKAGDERSGQMRMFRNAALGVSEAAAEKRDGLPARIAKLKELRAEDPYAHRIIWHDLEAEREAIAKVAPNAVAIFGRQDLDDRERAIIGFSEGEIAELAGKPVMIGCGVNLQRHCHWAIYLGIGHKFHDFIQSVHRLHRFLQTHPVRIDLIYSEAEREIRRNLEAKWKRHDELTAQMSAIVREYGLTDMALSAGLARSAEVIRQEKSGDGWRAINNDCIDETEKLDENSVDLIVTSIPFATQYEYTPSYRDFGHTDDNDHFWRQMDYLSPNLLRVLKPGRVMAIHCKDRIVPGGLNGLGFQTVQPFSDEAVAHFVRHGFAFLARKTIATDVVRENNQTYRLGWSEQCKDGSRMGCGMPEYVLLFRKPPTDRSNGYADEPVEKDKPLCDDHGEPAPFDPKNNWRHPVPGTGYSRARWQLDAHGFSRSSGDRLLSLDELRSMPHDELYKWWRAHSAGAVYSFDEHLRVSEELDHLHRLPATFMLFPPHSAHPDVWSDIARMRTMNMLQAARGREMHLCPLQFDIVDRLIIQFSMRGETVFDPFGGLMTVPYCALKLGRRGLGIELSPIYWADGVGYLRAAENQLAVPSLLDLMGVPAEAAE